MCYSDQAAPPPPPAEGGPASRQILVLRASDGAQFHACLALPEAPASAGVIIYPDVRGLFQFYEDLALRFAEQGIAAIALDYFGRTAGLTSRAEGFEYMPHVEQITLVSFSLDVRAALARLGEALPAGAPVYVVGFCMGGSLALITGSMREFSFAGLIPFYSGFKRSFGGPGTVLELAMQIASPVLGFYGGEDQGIPASAVEQLDKQLDVTGQPHRLNLYPGAPHSFFDRHMERFAGESEDAWRQILTFIRSGSIGG